MLSLLCLLGFPPAVASASLSLFTSIIHSPSHPAPHIHMNLFLASPLLPQHFSVYTLTNNVLTPPSSPPRTPSRLNFTLHGPHCTAFTSDDLFSRISRTPFTFCFLSMFMYAASVVVRRCNAGALMLVGGGAGETGAGRRGVLGKRLYLGMFAEDHSPCGRMMGLY